MAKTINAAYANLNLQDCLNYGGQLVSHALIENSQQVSATTQAIQPITKLFEALQKHPHISNALKRHRFDWNEVQRLIKLIGVPIRGYKDALEKEEKLLQVAQTIRQSESSALILHDVKFKRKEDLSAITAILEETSLATTAVSVVPTAPDSPIQNNNNAGKKTTTSSKSSSSIPQINQLFGQLINRREEIDSSFVNIDENNRTMQSIAKIREGKLSMAKASGTATPSRAQQKKYGARFSDDEEDEKNNSTDQYEYVPLREEDFEALNESLQKDNDPKSNKKGGDSFQRGALFDPDAVAINIKLDEAPESSQVVSLLRGVFDIRSEVENTIGFIAIDPVYILSTDDAKDVMLMPKYPLQSQGNPMAVKGVLSLSDFTSYHTNLIQEKMLNPERKIRLVSGWLEAESYHQALQLQNYALQLKTRSKVAVIEWTPECKLYLLHRDQWNTAGNQTNTILYRRNFFVSTPSPNDVLLYVMIFKQYKLNMDTNAYESLVPIFMQRRTSSLPISMSIAAAAAAAATQQILPSTTPARITSASVGKMSVGGGGNGVHQGLVGKKSFGKISALEALTFESDEEDPEEERRLNERVAALKN